MPRTMISLRNWRYSAIRSMLILLLLPALVAGLGCGKSGAKNSVTGKVTLQDKPVSGSIKYIGSDGKEALGPINPNGTYVVNDPPLGDNKIVIEGVPGMNSGTLSPEAAKAMQGVQPAQSAPAMGVAPPRRYSMPGNGLTFNVTGGVQKNDIELKP